MLAQAALKGILAGGVGVAAMTLGEKLEQAVTKRPNSYVPAHTAERLLRLPEKPDEQRWWLNHAMHWGQGMLLGALRGVWAASGLRGPRADAWYTALRLAVDQTLENATGVGAPPWTWPRRERVIDVSHKAVYAFTTGAVADALVAPRDR
jgi:hypothetical protein